MDDSEEERRLETLTFNQIREIAEDGVDPNLPMREKRELYKNNFYSFMENSNIYFPHIFSILGQKLLDEITKSFDYKKRTEPPNSPIHKYNTAEEYIDDEDTMTNHLYVNEPAEILMASLGDAMIAYGEKPREPSEDFESSEDYADFFPRQESYHRRRITNRRRKTDPTQRPQRHRRRGGGSKTKKTRKTRKTRKIRKTRKTKKM